MNRIVIIGGGRIGSALATALRADAQNVPAILTRRAEHALQLAGDFGVEASHDPTITASAAAVVYAVKPHDMAAAITRTREHLSSGALVISLATGVTIKTLSSLLPDRSPICRAVTTTAAQVRRATSVLAADQLCSSQRRLAEDVFRSAGTIHHVSEATLDAASVIAGGGGAYVYFLVEVLTHAGVAVGLSAHTARELARGAAAGATAMLDAQPERHPAQLREDVMSRGGATIAAFHVLEQRATRADLIDAVTAAHRRCAELGVLEANQSSNVT